MALRMSLLKSSNVLYSERATLSAIVAVGEVGASDFWRLSAGSSVDESPVTTMGRWSKLWESDLKCKCVSTGVSDARKKGSASRN